MKENIAIIGGGGHAKVVSSIILNSSKYQLLGYFDIKDRGRLNGIPYLGKDNSLYDSKYKKLKKLVLGIGDLGLRKSIVTSLAKDYEFPTIISSQALVDKSVQVKEGTVIMPGAVVNVESKIGKYCIINTSVVVEHESKIDDFVHLAPRSTLCGNVTVGKNTHVGASAVIIENCRIKRDCIVGAGSVVINELKVSGLYTGTPAQLKKSYE